MKNFTILSLLLTVFIFNSSCQKEEKQKEKTYRSVRYIKVGNTTLSNNTTYSGKASADQEMELSFRNNGIIIKKLVKVGQKVKKGELLMQLDNIQAQLSYEQSLASLNAAKSEMYTAKSEYERGRKLYEQGNYTLSKYETVKNTFENASNQLTSAERKLAIDHQQILNGYIYAPKDAVVAEVNANMNETVSSGQKVMVLNAGNKMNVIVGVSESSINDLSNGMLAHLNFKSIGERLDGEVVEVSPILNKENATFPVKIKINNPSASIHPGMAVEVKFDLDGLASEYNIVLPLSAIGEDESGNFVFTVENIGDDLGVVGKQYIKVGELTDEGILIDRGVEQGQYIITAGLQTLINGQIVKL
ncbi:efflux RND transporter periplasmic adaptor subunit [Flammeovirga aprica]|uniref:Efflux RND transporter periplasmic adaptor subunit n=1 Tax=Flammeovirga aprica JL-4 TaxID=694437 RepID=A0A7X9S1M1_9BACT|nr:efflux RND transporter periplasmic adaptor subunit [Flammeovirga aprica]NME72609.1 efflux RND transporter periplasmic adaptor subunit [Flammeovirga aprica JL-4]